MSRSNNHRIINGTTPKPLAATSVTFADKAAATVSGVDITFADANPDTITRASGDFVADGWEAGDYVTVSGSASNDGTYLIDTVAATILTLDAAEALVAEGPSPGITLTANTKSDTITRAAGNFETDGYYAGMLITVASSVSNNATFKVASVSGAVLTLAIYETLTDEGPVAVDITPGVQVVDLTYGGALAKRLVIGHTGGESLKFNFTGQAGTDATIPTATTYPALEGVCDRIYLSSTAEAIAWTIQASYDNSGG